MPQSQLLFDFETATVTTDPIKTRMLDAIIPLCVHSRQRWLRRECSCAGTVKATLRALDTFQQNNPVCDPSIDILAAQAGCSHRTMQRWLRLTENLGYVSTIIGDRARSTYSINWLRIWNETEEPAAQPPMRVVFSKMGAI